MSQKVKRTYSRRGFPMNLGLQKYVLGKMANSCNINEYLPDGWENDLDKHLTLPEQFDNKMAEYLNKKRLTILNINSDKLFNLEMEIYSLINKMYLSLQIEG